MATMLHDRFEAWVRERSRGCLAPSEIDQLCEGDLDIDSGEYTFTDQTVQSQWEAWQEATRPVHDVTLCHLPYQESPFVHGWIDGVDGPKDVWLRNDGQWTTEEGDSRNSLVLSEGWNPPEKVR